MNVQNYTIKLPQRVAQQVIGNGLGDILTSQTAPQPGAGPLGGVLRWFPRRLGVADAVVLQPGEWVAKHPARGQRIPEMATVEQVSYAPSGELLAPVSHGPGVLLLKLLPEADGPLIVAAPGVHHALGIGLGQTHTVDASHRREGAHATREPAGQLLHLADLALGRLAVAVVVGLDVVVGAVERASGVDDVGVQARLKDVQLGLARPRQPRVYPSLNG